MSDDEDLGLTEPGASSAEGWGGSADDTLVADDSMSGGRARLERGILVGRYELQDPLGAGGMGIVFAAHDPVLDRRVALKVVRPERTGPRARERLLREARALAQVEHANVVTVNDVGVDGDVVYMAMTLVDGQTLGAWLEQTERGPSEVIAMLMQAGRGLEALHDAGLVHRDFKPDNVLVTPDGRALVADLGIVQAAEEESWRMSGVPSTEASVESEGGAREPDRLTLDGAMMGTPRTMAPEQFLMEPTDARTDLFAFCVVLWEALYGQHPFDDADINRLIVSITTDDGPRIPSDVEVEVVPPGVHAILVKGLRRSPDARFDSMDELLRALDSVMHRRGRRWPWVAGSVAAGVAVAAAWLAASQGPAIPECDPSARIEQAWNAAEASRVLEAFAATALPMAQTSGEQVLSRLDVHRDEWVEAFAATCVAPPGPVVERWRGCLEDRRRAMAGLVGALQATDETVVLNAEAAVLELESPASCADDPESLALVAAIAPETRDEVADVEGRLQEAWALHSMGADARALEMVRDLPSEAQVLGQPPLVARARLVRGLIHHELDDEAEAIADLEEAVSLAIASRTDDVVARAATALIGLSHGYTADVVAAERWARHAEVALERLGHPPRMAARHLRAKAVMSMELGRYDEADAELERALELLREEPVRNELAIAMVENDRGQIAVRRGRHAEGIAAYERARSGLVSALGPGHPHVTNVLASMQEAHRQQGNLEQARILDDRIFPILEAAYGPSHQRTATALARRGTLFAIEGRYEEAYEAMSRAAAVFEARQGAEHPRVADVLTSRGIVLGRLGRFEDAVADQRRALRIYEAFEPAQSSSIAVALDNLGAALVDAGEPAEALALHQRALSIWEAIEPGSISMAVSSIDQARAQRGVGESERAVELLERAIEILEDKTFDPVELARARVLLARSLRDLGRDAERATRLAQAARDVYRREGERAATELAELETWLDESGRP